MSAARASPTARGPSPVTSGRGAPRSAADRTPASATSRERSTAVERAGEVNPWVDRASRSRDRPRPRRSSVRHPDRARCPRSDTPRAPSPDSPRRSSVRRDEHAVFVRADVERLGIQGIERERVCPAERSPARTSPRHSAVVRAVHTDARRGVDDQTVGGMSQDGTRRAGRLRLEGARDVRIPRLDPRRSRSKPGRRREDRSCRRSPGSIATSSKE